jgi:hypothetical protein
MSLHDDYIMMQNGFVEEIAPVLMGIGNVKGILLSGSHSKGTHGPFSDIDLSCFLQEWSDAYAEQVGKCVTTQPGCLSAWHLEIIRADVRHIRYAFTDGVLLDLVIQSVNGYPVHDPRLSKVLYDPEKIFEKKFRPGVASPAFRLDPSSACTKFRLIYGEILGARGPVTNIAKLKDAYRWMNEIRNEVINALCQVNSMDEIRAEKVGATVCTMQAASMQCSARLLLDIYQDAINLNKMPDAKLHALRGIMDEMDRIAGSD